jgi:purine nucleoside phosphorylase
MSTVPEVIVAVQVKIEVLAISVVTNMSNLFHGEVHHQADIESCAQKAYGRLSTLLQKTIGRF